MPRSARSNSTSRRLRLNTWYSHTAWLMISAGKRWRWCGSGGCVIPQSHSSPHLPPTPVTDGVDAPRRHRCARVGC